MSRRRAARGVSYVEVLVAVALLALCAAPAAEAIRNGIGAGAAGAAKARELRCIKNKMETVLTQSYDDLWRAARGAGQPAPDYSQAADADGACDARNVYIAHYGYPSNSSLLQVFPYPIARPEDALAAEDALLLVKVSGPDPDAGYSLTSLVDR